LSSARSLECSVSQGSCLGPWLNFTYAGTLFDIIPPSVTVHGFADDHTENVRFNPSNENAEMNPIETLENCAFETNNWMNGNRLKMNTTKTEFIESGSKHPLSKCSLDKINIAFDEIESKNCIRYLGAYLDENLNFKDHVKRKCHTAMFTYLKIKKKRQEISHKRSNRNISLVSRHLSFRLL
jgi:hypothetical protein